MKIYVMMGAAASMLVVATPAGAANLLTNGSFESGLTGWTVTTTNQTAGNYSAPVTVAYGQNSDDPTYGASGNIIVADNSASLSPDAAGSNFLYLYSDVGVQTFRQTVTLQAGRTYRYGFSYLQPPSSVGNPFNANVSFGLTSGSTGSYSATATSADVWRTASFTRTVTGAASQAATFTISFNPTGVGPDDRARDFVVDRAYLIDVTPAAVVPVPEPATWATMILGFALAGGAARRRVRTTLRIA